MLKKTPSGTWENEIGKTVDLEKYEDINEIVERQVEDLSSNLDFIL